MHTNTRNVPFFVIKSCFTGDSSCSVSVPYPTDHEQIALRLSLRVGGSAQAALKHTLRLPVTPPRNGNEVLSPQSGWMGNVILMDTLQFTGSHKVEFL